MTTRDRIAPSRSAGSRSVHSRRSRAVRALRRLVLPAVLALSTAAALVIGVFPTRTYLDKRDAVAAAEARLESLEQANAAAETQVEALRSDAEIERLARRDHGLAYPGEETYVVLPPPMDAPEWPSGWPFTHLHLRALPD